MISTYRNTNTGETAPAHRVGIDADGRELFSVPAGWEPTTQYEINEDGLYYEAEDSEGVDDDTLTATHNRYGWSVEDSEGGRWWPDADTKTEIEESDDPEATALRICRDDPGRGTWHN